MAALNGIRSGEPLPVNGLLLFSGCYDIAKHYEWESDRGVEALSAMGRAMGGEAMWEQYSPLQIVRSMTPEQCKSLPPILLFHETGDVVVPETQTTDFHQ